MVVYTARKKLWRLLLPLAWLIVGTGAFSPGQGVCVGHEDISCLSGEPLGGSLSLDCTGDDYMISYDTKIDILYTLLIYTECSVPCNQNADIYYYDLTDVSLPLSNLQNGTVNGSCINLPHTSENTVCRVFGCFTYFDDVSAVFLQRIFSPTYCTPAIASTIPPVTEAVSTSSTDETKVVSGITTHPGLNVNTTDQPSQHTHMEYSSPPVTEAVSSSSNDETKVVSGTTHPSLNANTTDHPSHHTHMENSSSDATDIPSQYVHMENNTSDLSTFNSTNVAEGVVLIVSIVMPSLLVAIVAVVAMAIVILQSVLHLEKHNMKKAKYPCYSNEVSLSSDVKVIVGTEPHKK